MAFNVTVDTNVILDAILSRQPWAKDAEKIILLAAEKQINASVTASEVPDIFYVVSKFAGKSQAMEVVINLAKLFDFISVDRANCIKAMATRMNDFETALLSVCAAKAKSKYIITRKVGDFADSIIPAITPAELVENFK